VRSSTELNSRETSLKRNALHTLLCLLLLLAVAGGIFAYSIHLRRPWFGKLSASRTPYITNPLIAAKQWYREGMLNVGAGMYMRPRSVEFPTLAHMQVYKSYPPGLIVPIYAVGRLLGREPSLAMLMACSLADQFLVALLLALTVFVFLRQIQCSLTDAFVFSLIPLFMYLLLPPPLFEHQMHYLPDTAVLPLFVLYVFLEVLRDSVTDKRWRVLIACLQGLTAFAGILTEYLFGCLALCAYVARLMRGQMGKGALSWVKNSAAFWFPMVAGMVLFLMQLYFLIGFEDIVYKFRTWTDASSHGMFLPVLSFWRRQMLQGFGKTGVALLWGASGCFVLALAYAFLRRLLRKETNERSARALALIFVLLAPCFMHSTLLAVHSAFPLHYFSALKFAVPLAAVPFVLVPVLVLSCFNAGVSVVSLARLRALVGRGAEHGVPRWSFVPLAMALLAASYVYHERPRIAPQFTAEGTNERAMTVARFVGANTGYEDIVFALASDLALPRGYEAISMKEVYVAPSLQRIYTTVYGLEGEYVVNVLAGEDAAQRRGNAAHLIDLAYEEVTSDDLGLYKVRKQDFLALCKKYRVKPPSQLPTHEPRRPWAGRWKGEQGLIRRLSELGAGRTRPVQTDQPQAPTPPQQAPEQ